MDEQIEQMVVSVRADTRAFAGDVAAMRRELDGPLAQGADRAGRAMQRSLASALADGKLGFDDLKRVALAALGEIAAASLRGALGGSAPAAAGGSMAGLLGGALMGLLGLPGRATGGAVSAGRPYLVGERGPEMFVPERAGRIETGTGGRARDVRVAIRVERGGGQDEPRALARSARQVARAVRRALA